MQLDTPWYDSAMKYLQPLAIIVLLAIAVLDHWPTGNTDAATSMSRYATKEAVCRMVERMEIEPWRYEDPDIKLALWNATIVKPANRTCTSLFR